MNQKESLRVTVEHIDANGVRHGMGYCAEADEQFLHLDEHVATAIWRLLDCTQVEAIETLCNAMALVVHHIKFGIDLTDREKAIALGAFRCRFDDMDPPEFLKASEPEKGKKK